MKIFKISILVFLLFISGAVAQEWVNTNQATTAWDAIVYPVEAGERVAYKTYLVNAKTDPNKLNPSFIGETLELQYQFTFTEKGSYFVGVQSVVQIDEEGTWTDVTQSEIGWSDNPTYAQAGVTFGIRFYPIPPVPTGQRAVSN